MPVRGVTRGADEHARVLIEVPPDVDPLTAYDAFVNTTNGSVKLAVDIAIRADLMAGIAFPMSYNSKFGGWRIGFTDVLTVQDENRIELLDSSGERTVFARGVSRLLVPENGLRSGYQSAEILEGAIVVTSRSGRSIRFQQEAGRWLIATTHDPGRAATRVVHRGGVPVRIDDAHGQSIALRYAQGRLESLVLGADKIVRLAYAGAMLDRVVLADGESIQFHYSLSSAVGPQLRTVVINGTEFLSYEYMDVEGIGPRVTRVSARGRPSVIAYGMDWNETIVTSDDGFRSYLHDEIGRTIEVREPESIISRELDGAGRVRRFGPLRLGRGVSYAYESDDRISVLENGQPRVVLQAGPGANIYVTAPSGRTRDAVQAEPDEERSGIRIWSAQDLRRVFSELQGDQDPTPVEAEWLPESRRRPARNALIDGRAFLGRPVVLQLASDGVAAGSFIVQPDSNAILRPDAIDSTISGFVRTVVTVGPGDAENGDGATNPLSCGPGQEIVAVGEDPDGDGARCWTPPTDPECVDDDGEICGVGWGGGGGGGGGEPPPSCIWSLFGPSNVYLHDPATYSILPGVECFGSAVYSTSSGEPLQTIPNGGPATFHFQTLGSRTVTATYSGALRSKVTIVNASPCSYTTSTVPAPGSITVGQLVTVTPFGDCNGYTYSVSGVAACPLSGSGSNFQTRFAAVGNVQIGINGLGDGPTSTSAVIPTSVTCMDVSGPASGLVNSPVCFTGAPPAPSATVGWSAPGGAPATGTGATFCTTFASLGARSVSVSLSMPLPACSNLIASCSDVRSVNIEPPPTVVISTASPVVLLGSQTASVSAAGSPAGGTYAWSASSNILSITPATGAQVTIAATSTGVATLSVVYTTAAGTSSPASIQVHAIDVTEVKWEGVARNDGQTNFGPGTNPADRGGDDRIFPDRNHPSGTAGDDRHDQIRVVMKLSSAPPSGAMVTAYFQLFDPDHYSQDLDFDPNAAQAGNDNVFAGTPMILGTGASLSDEAFTTSTNSVTIFGDGVRDTVRVGLLIEQIQPGNNWRIAGGLEANEVNAVVLGPDGQSLLSNSAPGAPPWPIAKRTKLLTVWRKAYVEIDRMADPVLDVGLGRSRFNSGTATPSGAQVTLGLPAGDTIDPSQTDQFKSGIIELRRSGGQTLGTFPVTANSTGAAATLTLGTTPPANTANFASLVDDDISNASPYRVATSGAMTVDTSWWLSRMSEAHILPVFNQPEVMANNQVSVPFQVHFPASTVPAEQPLMRTLVSANRQCVGTPDFWVVYQLGAFQPGFFDEMDPNTDSPASGLSSQFSAATTDLQSGTVVFAEVIREQAENVQTNTISVASLKQAVSVHEIGHEFGILEGSIYGPLMDVSAVVQASTQQQLDALRWSGTALRRMILTRKPGYAP